MTAGVLPAVPSEIFGRSAATASEHITIDAIKTVPAYVLLWDTNAGRIVRYLRYWRHWAPHDDVFLLHVRHFAQHKLRALLSNLPAPQASQDRLIKTPDVPEPVNAEVAEEFHIRL
jgi:hypothetical protein